MAGEREACLKTNEQGREKPRGERENGRSVVSTPAPPVPPPGAKASGGGVLSLRDRGSDRNKIKQGNHSVFTVNYIVFTKHHLVHLSCPYQIYAIYARGKIVNVFSLNIFKLLFEVC